MEVERRLHDIGARFGSLPGADEELLRLIEHCSLHAGGGLIELLVVGNLHEVQQSAGSKLRHEHDGKASKVASIPFHLEGRRKLG
ncbi:hypothetical protein ABZP36_015376 [Zizania latifolia]